MKVVVVVRAQPVARARALAMAVFKAMDTKQLRL